jgi:pilus assembly protein Flp/PilA
MLRLWTSIQSRFIADDEGASLVEYALLVALIAIVAIAAIVLLGQRVSTTLNSAGQQLP